jgi:hypothetical protein
MSHQEVADRIYRNMQHLLGQHMQLSIGRQLNVKVLDEPVYVLRRKARFAINQRFDPSWNEESSNF